MAARTAAVVYTLHLNDSEVITPTVLDATNGMSVVCDKDALTLVVYNSDTLSADVTIKAKSGVAAEDKVITLATGETAIIGNLESALYKQSDGKLNLDFTATATGTVYAIQDAV